MNTTISIKELQERGILLTTGEVNSGKLNIISGTMAAPFIETLWELSNNNLDVLNRFYIVISGLYKQGRESEAVEVLHLLYDILDMDYPDDVKLLCSHSEARSYFLFEMLIDIDEIIQELIPDV